MFTGRQSYNKDYNNVATDLQCHGIDLFRERGNFVDGQAKWCVLGVWDEELTKNYMKLVLAPQMGQGIMPNTVGEFHVWNWLGVALKLWRGIALLWLITVRMLFRFRHNWLVERSGKWAEPDYSAMVYPKFACGAGYVLSSDLVHWLADNSYTLAAYQVYCLLTYCQTHRQTTFWPADMNSAASWDIN